MVYLWLPRGHCVAAVILNLMMLSPPVALVRDPQPRFLEQLKAECHYFNGRERVWTVTRFIYNQEEFARFQSDVGKFLAVTELGRPIAEYLNTQKDMLDNYRASVDRCRNNYDLVDIFMLNLKACPSYKPMCQYSWETSSLQDEIEYGELWHRVSSGVQMEH
ncbi:rano class II histocompatibility antigen, D-1 beta chain-like [Mastomys coucha]|uniref:rano class II histocompatibility antigen, D-1 beta chain-like n=1 Tax=Mastomys coucha TaxID=35658 RepID=UPI00126219FB|nr:rano class II histocompatibility antigen, D-1 beta chain-like [Mastomys coucha]